MTRITSRWTRKRLAALVVFVGVALYVFVAVWMQPVASGNSATLTGIAGHNPTNKAVYIGGGLTPQEMVWPYVDGGVATLVTSITNSGPVGLTITGVETNGRPPQWAGVFTLPDARAATLANPG